MNMDRYNGSRKREFVAGHSLKEGRRGARKGLIESQKFNDSEITLECMEKRKVIKVFRVHCRSFGVVRVEYSVGRFDH